MATRAKMIRERLEDENPEARLADGFDEALIGIGRRVTMCVAVYSEPKCIKLLMERDGMDEEEAQEYFDFNVAGAWVGEHTPIFLTPFEDDPPPKPRQGRRRRLAPGSKAPKTEA